MKDVEIDPDADEEMDHNELVGEHNHKQQLSMLTPEHTDPEEELWSTNSHYRITKRGKILKSVTERYLRHDLGYGQVSAPKVFTRTGTSKSTQSLTTTLSTPTELQSYLTSSITKPRLCILDANILIHQLDLLEHSSQIISQCVVCQTALMECRNVNQTNYKRVLEFLGGANSSSSGANRSIFFADENHVEIANSVAGDRAHNANRNSSEGNGLRRSTNDENDERIRHVAYYFADALRDSEAEIILLTDDAGSRKILEREDRGVTAMSMRSYVMMLQAEGAVENIHDILDSIANFSDHKGSRSQRSASDALSLYEPHLPATELRAGIGKGLYHRGILRVSNFGARDLGCNDCYITVRGEGERVAVLIRGVGDVNRALDGDVVVVMLHPVDRWISTTEGKKEVTDDTKIEDVAGIMTETADATLAQSENITESAQAPKPTGKVVGILQRNTRQNYCGSIHARPSELHTTPDSTSTSTDAVTPHAPSDRDTEAALHEVEHPDGSHTCLFYSVDVRIPPLLLRTTQRSKLLNQRILVTFDSWPDSSPYPLGHYVRSLGTRGEKNVETEVLLHEHSIPTEPFSPRVLACLPPADFTCIPHPDRTDLRHLPILSIDPPGCKDIDDALHCLKLPNGNFQVGVHIADVTHYVRAGTAIDLEAANRSTSTYLVNKRLDMFPSLLTTDLCSLRGNIDRYAFSVLWEVKDDEQATIVDVSFTKSLIHSVAALTYAQAQAYIDAGDANTSIPAQAVQRLAKLSRIFRAKRIAAGALTLASPEVKFVLKDNDRNNNPTDVQAYTLLEANALVEEFMLLANVTVGKKILRHYPTLAILRRHPSPNRSMFEGLISKAKTCRQFEIDISTSKTLADSLNASVDPSDPYVNKLLRILATRCMSPAQYFGSGDVRPQEWHHYGLAAPVYTHFTSPIRRYADVCVHRLLAASLGVQSLPTRLSSRRVLSDLAANMNRRHRSAQLAGRGSVQLHTLLFFAGDGDGETNGGGGGGAKSGKEEDAYVLDVDTSTQRLPSFTVMVPRYGIEGRVQITSAMIPGGVNDPHLVRDAHRHCIQYNGTNSSSAKQTSFTKIQVFDKVRVNIWVKHTHDGTRELILDLVTPQFGVVPAVAVLCVEEPDTKMQPVPSSNKKKKKSKRQKTK
eukprot:CAMPEP_0194368876 /NCGR_PEP_ID=MMETSP0174-20130528/17104_1 /TAXON_ID=216777 /ORGANISM="Proboscia alata, Strain PI-D3" /LENGTH=1142 /DNA_ID=CAMNT_0039145459 /DNA_START=273 /DNA_END=3701 /DNA_ORIENTATION=-